VRVCQQRPIQFSGWAFQLQRLLSSWAEIQAASVWASIVLAVLCTMLFVSTAPLYAQLDEGGHPFDHVVMGLALVGGLGSRRGLLGV